MRRSRRSSTAPEPASGSRSSRRSRSSASGRTALALLAGGALGNLVDRVRDGAVTDFIRWRVHDHRWPIFNVADAALLVGVLLLTLSPQSKARGESKAGAMLAG